MGDHRLEAGLAPRPQRSHQHAPLPRFMLEDKSTITATLKKKERELSDEIANLSKKQKVSPRHARPSACFLGLGGITDPLVRRS